jgi:hypothetical protein
VPALILFSTGAPALGGGRPVLSGADASTPGEPGMPKIGRPGYQFTINADLLKLFPQLQRAW